MVSRNSDSDLDSVGNDVCVVEGANQQRTDTGGDTADAVCVGVRVHIADGNATAVRKDMER